MNIESLSAITYTPIGVIRSSHHAPDQTPIQPVFATGCAGRAELQPQFAAGLADIDGFSHLMLFYHLHRAQSPQMLVTPFMDDQQRGIFATRHPRRPNPIGYSIVRLVRVEGSVLHLEDVDILDGTPLLDIKPYIPRFDSRTDVRGGWTESVDEQTARQRGQRARLDSL